MSITAEDIINTLEFVNSFRQAAGLPTLADLPQGIPGEPKQCILARAFNFEGEVNGNQADGYWHFEASLPEEPAKALSAWAEKSLPPGSVMCNEIAGFTDYYYIYIQLPEEVGKIAVAFDQRDDALVKYVDPDYTRIEHF